ncbi:MAG: type II toxin-antitoxin system VapC family toxin [Proteobacteria bacterium]|nr:type II toxin-antitoxin system VapC family toxin [Pseudomonadota bacterium]
MILLDTHVLVWLDQGSALLGKRARRTIEQSHQKEEVAIASVSFWEIGMLIEKGRLAFQGSLTEWRVSLLNSGFIELPADGNIALAAASLKEFAGDPVDRMISATALNQEAKLVTADDRLLGHRGMKTINGLT